MSACASSQTSGTMTRLAIRRHPASVPRALPKIGLAAGIAAGLGLLLVCASLLRVPQYVAKLAVINPSVYQVNLEVADAERAGWLDLGAVESESTTTLEETIDQGKQWVFRFSYGGVQAGETTIARSELKANGWKLTIPSEVGERLRDAGVAPSAR